MSRVPCVRDDDVVEGLVSAPEAGEADFHDHGNWAAGEIFAS